MPLRFTHRILEHLAHENYAASKIVEIARNMRVDEADFGVFKQSIEQLAQDGQLIIDKNDRVHLPSYDRLDEITGRFKLTSRGFGFVISDQPFRDGDLFIPPDSTGGAISGDQVRVKVIRSRGKRRIESGRSPFTGRIIEVLERGQEHFVGTLVKDGKRWLVKPDGRSLHEPVLIRDPQVKGAKPGDKVVIELLHYPEGSYVAEGVILKVLGEAGKPDVETQAVIAAHGLRQGFHEDVVHEARHASRSFERLTTEAKTGREDLTAEFIFTIDPPDAKDFDDAISIHHDTVKDEWTLGIHIADVSEFVNRGTALDEEAKERGNSVYLPRLVLPMLPEVLSNGVCSLQEGVPRLTKSVFVTLNGKGKVLHQRYSSTVISSRKRMTYLEAQALIEGDLECARQHAVTETEHTDELITKLKQCDQLARVLQRRRREHGMIILNLPEVELVFGDEGHVSDVVPEDGAFTHTIIEMFMVEANEAVARLFDQLQVPIIRRIHPDPVHGDIEELRLFARAVGLHVPNEPTRQDLQRLLEASRKTPAARAIHFAVLRTLTKATYSPALIGHFALASDHYAHFTSPIRRYPDLTVHRALQAFLKATDNGRHVPKSGRLRALGRELLTGGHTPHEGVLIEVGKHCSETEEEAERAEEELRNFLVLQFLHEHHLGDEFAAVVTGVMSGGVFVSIDRFLIEGRINMKDMPTAGERSDRWLVDESAGRVRAQRSGAEVTIGDIVTIQIVKVDLARRHLDLLITELPDRATVRAEQNEKNTRRNKSRLHDKKKQRNDKRLRRRQR